MSEAPPEVYREGARTVTAQRSDSKRKSGSETRRRTEHLALRLLPSEQAALRALADQASHRSVQAWILEVIKPHMENAQRLQTTDSTSG